MNKKVLLASALSALFAVSALSNAAFASENTLKQNLNDNLKNAVSAQKKMHDMPPAGENIYNKPAPNHQFKHGKHKFHPSKEEMEQKKAEFEKRLNLTDEQKKLIEEHRKTAHEQIKPLFEQKKAKLNELKNLHSDSSLTKEQLNEKVQQIKSELKQLDEQADTLRKEHMKSFENILTTEQQKEFAKIKAEQKKEMEKFKSEFEKKKRYMKMKEN